MVNGGFGGLERPPGPLIEEQDEEGSSFGSPQMPMPTQEMEEPLEDGGEMGAEMGEMPEGQQPQMQQPDNTPESFRKLAQYAQMVNIAVELDKTVLADMGQRCKREYEIDKTSRADWLEKVRRYKELALQQTKPKSYPFDKASNIIWPLLSTATNEFAAAAYPSIIKGRDVVKGVVVGDDDGKPVMDEQGQPVMDQSTMKPKFNPMTMETELDENGQPIMDPASAKPQYYEKPGAKRLRADLIGRHMSWQRLSQDKSWQQDTDRLLRILPIVGSAARKVFWEPRRKVGRTVLVSMEDLVINYWARSMDSAPRITEVFTLYPHEIEEEIRSGRFMKFSYVSFNASDEAQGADPSDVDAPQTFLEQHRRWDLDGDGYAEPYVVTVHESSATVVSITACFDWDAESIELTENEDGPQIVAIHRKTYYILYGFIPNPESAIYSHGWGHLLGPINEAINTSINQLFDAGHLSNVSGGFIGSQLSMHSGPLKFKMGEFKIVNTMGSSIRDAIYQMQHPGPSPVLFQLLGALFEAGRELGGVRNILQGQQTPASTDPAALYAILEQGQKVFKDIFKRVYHSLTEEFRELFRINRKNLPEPGERFQTGDLFEKVTKKDYELAGGVEPVADPDMITDIQRMGRAQFLLSMKDDGMMDGMEIRKRALEAAGIENIEALLPPRDGPTPMDQVTFEQAKAIVDKTRAEEIEKHTAALLNMMKARQIASDIDGAALDKQIKLTMLHLEGVQNLIQATQAEARMIELRHKTRLESIRVSNVGKKKS